MFTKRRNVHDEMVVITKNIKQNLFWLLRLFPQSSQCLWSHQYFDQNPEIKKNPKNNFLDFHFNLQNVNLK